MIHIALLNDRANTYEQIELILRQLAAPLIYNEPGGLNFRNFEDIETPETAYLRLDANQGRLAFMASVTKTARERIFVARKLWNPFPLDE